VTADFESFAAAAIVPLCMLVGQVWLIWWADFRFEDQAVEIAREDPEHQERGTRRAAIEEGTRRREAARAVAARADGTAWKALVWRTSSASAACRGGLAIRLGVIVLVLAALLGSLFASEGHAPNVPTRVGFVLLALLLYVSLLAPSLVRVDLRIDIPHFDVLKAMPMRGRSLIFGEILGTVFVLWLVQAAGWHRRRALDHAGRRTGVPLERQVPRAHRRALRVLFAIDFALVTIENLVALWLPGFRAPRSRRAHRLSTTWGRTCSEP
jgi:hypothetical protein